MEKRWKTNHASSVIFGRCVAHGPWVDFDDMPRLGQQPDGSFLPLQAVVGGEQVLPMTYLMGLVYKPLKKMVDFFKW